MMNLKGVGYTTNENHVVLGEAQDFKSATNKQIKPEEKREGNGSSTKGDWAERGVL